MKCNFRTLIFIIFCFSFFNTQVYSFERDNAVDMWEEPRHQLLYSQENIRLLLVNIPVNDTSQLHKHEFATAYVLLEDALMTSREKGEDWKQGQAREMREVGKLVDRADYLVKPFAHQVRNIGSNTFRLIALVNTRPERVAGSLSVESVGKLDNAWFKEHRLELSARETSTVLEYAFTMVVIQISKGNSEIVDQHTNKTLAGAWSIHKAGQKFQLKNNSEHKIKFVLIEVK